MAPRNIQQVGITVTAGGLAGLSCSVAVYTNRPNSFLPHQLIDFVVIPAGSNATFSIPFTPNLTPGEWYWLAHHNPHAHTFRGVAIAGQRALGGDNTMGVNLVTHFTSASNWGTSGSYSPAYPSTITSNPTAGSNTTLPVVGFRVIE
jgi:hypothetical protein